MSRILLGTKNNLLPLAQNPAYNFSANHAMHIFRQNTIYTFIPKNACSTMRLSIALNNGAIREANEHNWIHKNNITWKPALKDIIVADYTFVILRCPFARIASVFLDKIVSKEINAWILYEQTNRSIDLDKITFREFVSLISKKTYLNCDPHWRPQVDFLLYEEYDEYFSLEMFGHIRKTLLEKIDFTVVDSRPYIKHHTYDYEKISKGNYSDVPASEIATLKMNGRCPSHATLYTPEIYNLIENTFHSDLNLYKEKFGKETIMTL